MIATSLVELIIFIFLTILFNSDIQTNNVGTNDVNVGANDCMRIDVWMI